MQHDTLRTEAVMDIQDGRRRSFFILDNDAVDRAGRSLGPITMACYASLVRHSGQDRRTWPSMDTIAEEWGISRRAVVRAIQALTDTGMITREKRPGQHNIYRIMDPAEWRIGSDSQSQVDRVGSDSQSQGSDSQSQVDRVGSDSQSQGSDSQSHEQDLIRIPKILNQRPPSPAAPEAAALATLLLDHIKRENPRSKLHSLDKVKSDKTLEAWTEPIEKLIRIDHQPPSLIRRVIEAIFTGSGNDPAFWRKNILSGEALRRNWDRISRLASIPPAQPTDPPPEYAGKRYVVYGGLAVKADGRMVKMTPETVAREHGVNGEECIMIHTGREIDTKAIDLSRYTILRPPRAAEREPVFGPRNQGEK